MLLRAGWLGFSSFQKESISLLTAARRRPTLSWIYSHERPPPPRRRGIPLIDAQPATWRRRNDRFINGGERASFKLGFIPPPPLRANPGLSLIDTGGGEAADRFLLLDWRKLVAQSDRYPCKIQSSRPACDCSLERLDTEWKTIFWPRPCGSSRNHPRISISLRRGFGSNRGSLEGVLKDVVVDVEPVKKILSENMIWSMYKEYGINNWARVSGNSIHQNLITFNQIGIGKYCWMVNSVM